MSKPTSRKKKPPKRILALRGPGAREDGRAEQPDVREWPLTYDHAIREFVA